MLTRDEVVRRLVLRSAPLLLVGAAACSAGNVAVSEEHAFSDGSGRSCRATLEKASASSPSLSSSIGCDGEAKQCSKESAACFQLSVDDTTFGVRNCPACCKGTASSYLAADCSALVCNTDVDCVYARATCVGGACVCANGVCE